MLFGNDMMETENVHFELVQGFINYVNSFFMLFAKAKLLSILSNLQLVPIDLQIYQIVVCCPIKHAIW